MCNTLRRRRPPHFRLNYQHLSSFFFFQRWNDIFELITVDHPWEILPLIHSEAQPLWSLIGQNQLTVGFLNRKWFCLGHSVSLAGDFWSTPCCQYGAVAGWRRKLTCIPWCKRLWKRLHIAVVVYQHHSLLSRKQPVVQIFSGNGSDE